MLQINANGVINEVVEADNQLVIGEFKVMLTNAEARRVVGFLKDILGERSTTLTDTDTTPSKDTKVVTSKKTRKVETLTAPVAKVEKSVKAETPKAEKSASKASKGKKDKTEDTSPVKVTKAETPKVLKVDKYGNQWIAEYNSAVYNQKKAEMIADGTYDSKNRSKVYKELGWIL